MSTTYDTDAVQNTTELPDPAPCPAWCDIVHPVLEWDRVRHLGGPEDVEADKICRHRVGAVGAAEVFVSRFCMYGADTGVEVTTTVDVSDADVFEPAEARILGDLLHRAGDLIEGQ